MADNSKIEWTDATWQPITGCSVHSPGCINCYAMKLAGGRLRNHPSRAGLTKMTKAGPVFTGEVRFNEQWLDQPLRWTRPRMVFTCAHGDLFHENVPDEWIDRVFRVMAMAKRHTFQVLTKRSARARTYLNTSNRERAIRSVPIQWPLPNVWLGVSAERQQEADERIPDLLATPAAVRFVSAEPLIGPIDLNGLALPEAWPRCDCRGHRPTFDALNSAIYCEGCCEGPEATTLPRLDWVIVGGESGPNARSMHSDWARLIRDQCAAAGTAFFMKQMDKKQPIPEELFIRQFPRDDTLWQPGTSEGD
jgi:protein gp37